MASQLGVFRTAAVWASVVAASACDSIWAANLPAAFSEFGITPGTINEGTAMEFSPDGKLYVLEQAGTIKVYQGSGASVWTQVAPNGNLFNGAPLSVNSNGERGLLGIAFHPNYAVNRFIFVYYTRAASPVRNRISRFKLNAAGTQALAGTETLLMNLPLLSSAQNHNGGAMHFGPDNKLYVAVGDNANGPNSQSITTRLGKILRLNPNPNNPIPTNNPTSIDGIAGTPTGPNRAIWAAGLRNPFTFAFQPGTGVMFINDVGAVTWEEINQGAAGANYGWPTTEGPFNQGSFPDFTHPLVYYHHSNDALSFPELANFQGMAITGGTFYFPDDPTFPTGFIGDYFFADFVHNWIKRYDPVSLEVKNFASQALGVVDLKVGSDGALYYLSRHAMGNGDGRVFRVQRNPPGLTAVAGPLEDPPSIDAADFLAVLSAWGGCADPDDCPADLAPPTGDGLVDADDLLAVICAWNPCP
ncbi:MAG: PQQ-dependent sugar dehydrogenase [Phycisphaerales bacterium]|nr:PQQ-dependent sugar dehydrogenase [Phycisphaerales bacterium]MCI0631978.1 PQQ-dependent sugar dehydrogenase [Phycisphaerales bacterium]